MPQLLPSEEGPCWAQAAQEGRLGPETESRPPFSLPLQLQAHLSPLCFSFFLCHRGE